MSATRAFIQSIRSPDPGHTHTGNPVGPDGIGRKFYTCFKGKGDSDNCGFFKWEDEIFQGEQEPMSNLSAPKFRSTQETPPTPSNPGKRYRDSKGPRWNQKSIGRSRSDVNDTISDDDEPQQKKLRIGTPLTEMGSYAEAPAPKPGAQPIFGIPQGLNTTPGQWETIRDDPENPFHDRASALRQTQATPSIHGSPSKGQSLTDSLTEIIGELTFLNGQVQRLERQRIATEKSRDAKSQRIAQLEKQVEELSNRNKSLEEEIEALRARR